MTLSNELLEVPLPVCLECGHIGKHPGQRRMQFDCTGPPGELHKRKKMQMVVFHADLATVEVKA